MRSEDLESYLHETGADARILTFERGTRTVEAAEKRLGVSRERIVKTLVFTDESGEPILGIISGDRRMSEEKLARACGVQRVKIAHPTAVRDLTGYEVGAMPPIAHKRSMRVVIDPRVMSFSKVYGGGGTVNALLEISPRDIKRLTNAEVADISE